MRALIKKIRQLLKDKRFRRIWYRGVSSTAAIVVFITTYALVLPAITMESEASCGIPAHQHTTDCYEEQLICGLEESEGHHHTDDCYTVTKELTCTTPEHQHNETCFDENGNLTCSQAEHTHDSTCYEEHRELTCGLEESEGHHHDSSCYKQVLTCGLEAHIHSVECYKEDSKAVTASTSIQASDDFDGAVAATAASTSVPAETYEPENASNGSNSSAAGTTSRMTTDDADSTDAFEAANASTAFDENSSTAELSSAAATTGVLPEPVEQEDLSEGYVPTLDPVNMDQVLDKHTGFYYYHAEEGEDLPASSTEITSWKKVDDNTELAPTDLVKAYFAYTIPAGTLNETNQVARYRLPSNLHLTDDQIIAINQQENGIAASYIDYDTLQILDTDNYNKYLGAEAIEGTRTPDQPLTEGTQEYISAVVKAENVYDDEGVYGEKGAYLGQDLIFIFTPYTIEKNQNTYDTDGNPTSAGQKVSGWFACDFNMSQIDWVEAESNTDHDKAAVEKTADILFAAQDDVLNIKEICQTLKQVETIEAPEDTAEGVTDDVTGDAAKEEVLTEETVGEADSEEVAADATEDNPTTDNEQSETAPTDTTADTDTDTEEEKYSAGTLTATGDSYKITLDYTAEAEIPADSKLHVTEITAESDPEAYEACLKQAQDQVVTDNRETVNTNATRFFDIEIQKNGKKIEPKATVKVNIQLIEASLATVAEMAKQDEQDKSAQNTDPTVLHFSQDGVETLEATTTPSAADTNSDGTGNMSDDTEGKQIQFETSSFSIYGVVYTSTITTTYITASGETYEITVTYDENAEIPEDSRLVVHEIEPGTEEYVRYLQKSENMLKLDAEGLSFARFFDIQIQDMNGDKVEPKTSVQVEISYADSLEIGSDESLNIIHFADRGVEVISHVAMSGDNKEITYQQASFSVSGTIVGKPSNGQQRMIVLKDGNRYFIVNNDASLTEVGYENNTVSVVEPMLWTFAGNNIYFNSEATGFNTNFTASDWYRRYLDPGSSIGTTEEVRSGTAGANQVGVTVTKTADNWLNPNDGQYVEVNSVTNRQNALSQTSVTIDSAGGVSTIRHGNTYFGIERDQNGTPARLIPQTAGVDRAQFVFAEASKVPSGIHLNNAVNHIDIAIDGTTQVNVPLAFGTYYLEDGTPVPILTNTTVTLTEDQAVDARDLIITAEDMKRATIMAYDKEGNEINDAFYITGFSQNATTNLSEVQVRIEGAFKVAQPEKDNPAYQTIDGTLYDGNWWTWQMPDQNYVNAVRQARLNNIIDYRLTVVKPVTFQLVDSQGRKLYVDRNQTPLDVSVDVAFSGSFNYWDYGESERNHGNECPPLENNQAWRAGDIPNHDLSGMDFRLKGYANDDSSPLVAIEIMKRIVDEKGNLITLGEPVTYYADVFENKDADRNGVKDYKIDPNEGTNPNRDNEEGIYNGYTELRGEEITVEAGTAQALIYDYNVTDAMYYIQERSSLPDLPETIKDNHYEEWKYVKTYIETEYVRRGYGGYDDKTEYPNPMHVSDDYYRGDEYKSSPEVVGNFQPVTGEPKKSGFLEFYIYNVYTKGKMLEVEKKWAPQDGTIPNGAEVTVELFYARGVDKQFPDKSEYEKVIAGQGPFDVNLKTTLTLTEDNKWQDAFEGLPETMTENGTVYDLDYYAKEVSVKIPGEGQTEINENAIDITNAYDVSISVNNGKEIIRNEREEVSLEAEKRWAEGTQIPSGAEVDFELRYSSRMAVNADGELIAEAERNPWPAKSTYEPLKVEGEYAALFRNDPGIDETRIVTELKLDVDDAVDGTWQGVFENLPKYLIAQDGSILEVDYYAVETAVRIPAAGRTAVDDDALDVTNDYFVTIEKAENNPEDPTSDGKVTITNEQNETSLAIEKNWSKGTIVPESAKVKAGLRFAARMIKDQNGRTITTPVAWPDKTAYMAVVHGQADELTTEGTGNEIVVTGLTIKSQVEVELSANTENPERSWKDSFTRLPKYLRDSTGNAWELDYYAVETAVNVLGAGSTVINKIADYIHTEEKTDSTGQDLNTSDGTVSITNKENITVTVRKKWNPQEPPEGGEATVQLKRYKAGERPDEIRTSMTVVKVWDDADNQDGKRPASLNVTLSGGEASEIVTLNGDNSWKATVDNLQAYDQNGDPINYTWIEGEMPQGYSLTNTTVLNNVTTLTNSYTPGKTSATVRIDWQDGSNRDGYRPESVVVTLDQNGQKVTLNDANDWTATISGLPEYRNGSKINYTWTSDTWTTGTTSAYSGNGKSEAESEQQSKITYIHDPEKTMMKVRIEWDDNENEDGSRPEGVPVSIIDYPGNEVLLTDVTSWTGSVELYKNENGNPVIYTWSNPIIAGYTQVSKETEPDGTIVMTYHHDPIPPKDYVTVTVHTVLREAREGYFTNWETNGWNTNIYNLNATFEGNQITMTTIEENQPDIHWNDQSKTLRAPLTFNVDKNSAVSFHINIGGTDVSLVDIGANGSTLTQTGSSTARDVSFDTGTQDVDIYVVLKGAEEKLPENSTVYMVVTSSGSGASGVAKDPANAVKSVTVPVNTDVAFNYDGFHFSTWNRDINPKYKVYYWHETQYETKWEPVSPEIAGDAPPDEDVVFNVGMKERYLVLVESDAGSSYQNELNCKLVSLVDEGNAGTNNISTLSKYNRNRKETELITDSGSVNLLNEDNELADNNVPFLLQDPIGTAESFIKALPSLLGNSIRSLQSGSEKENGNSDSSGSGLGTRGDTSTVIMSSPVTVPDGYVQDTSFDTPPVTLTLKDAEGYGWEQSFPPQEKFDQWGRPYVYYVDEIDFKPSDYVTESITGNPNEGETVVITNKKVVSNGSVKVTKSFSGIDSLPDGFTITATYTDAGEDKSVTLTTQTAGMTGTGTSGDPYTWILNEIPVGTIVTFTETGFTKEGYLVTINGKATASPVTVVAAETTDSTSTASFENAYTRNPGGLQLTKKVTGTGADTTKTFAFIISLNLPAATTEARSYATAINGASSAAITVPQESTSTSVTVDLKANDTWAVDGLPVGTTYTIQENDYSADGYTPSITSGSLSGTVSGGTISREEVEITNDFSAVDLTILKIDETTRNAADPSAQIQLPEAKFKLYKLTTPPGGASAAYTVYPDQAHCELTTEADGTLQFTGLPNGQYKIVESKVPDGYVTHQSVEFYFTVSADSTLTWTDSDGVAYDNQTEVRNMVGYVPSTKTFTVGNEPGAELPSTGGSGTRWIYILGVAMTLFAAGLLLKRKPQ